MRKACQCLDLDFGSSLLSILFIASAGSFAPIKRTITVNQVVNETTNIFRRTSVLDNTPNS